MPDETAMKPHGILAGVHRVRASILICSRQADFLQCGYSPLKPHFGSVPVEGEHGVQSVEYRHGGNLPVVKRLLVEGSVHPGIVRRMRSRHSVFSEESL